MQVLQYIVKPDDTLQRIAALYYRDWTLWSWISGINPGINICNLVSGSVLLLPYPIVEDNIHTVQMGDSYEQLSKVFYGTENLSERIKSANLDLELSKNIGKEILIPALVHKKVFSE